MKRDTEAVGLILKWVEESNPFNLVSFSTGFTSATDDVVNAERAAEVGMEVQINLKGKSVTSTMQVKFKVQVFSLRRKIPKVNEEKLHINSLKLFN